jgi:hypothetical protein
MEDPLPLLDGLFPHKRKGPFPLERFTATESSAVVIFTGNDIEEGFSPIERAATMSIACENRASFRFPHRKAL